MSATEMTEIANGVRASDCNHSPGGIPTASLSYTAEHVEISTSSISQKDAANNGSVGSPTLTQTDSPFPGNSLKTPVVDKPTIGLTQTAAAKLLGVTAASPSAIAAANDLTFAAIEETADLAASYARSAAEAAWRGDRTILIEHLAELRLTTIKAIRLFKSLDAAAAESRAA